MYSSDPSAPSSSGASFFRGPRMNISHACRLCLTGSARYLSAHHLQDRSAAVEHKSLCLTLEQAPPSPAPPQPHSPNPSPIPFC
jgi:hypothetical protein